ncbi:MAG: sigma factor-like helix-turn-helix DNA-binding protein [Isosphaeraceae bacterium]
MEGGRLLRAGRLTHAEIARRLGINLRAVRQWAKQLRDLIRPRG